jgi:hypothetical protein
VIRTASFIVGRRVRAALLSRLLSRRVPYLARVLRVAQLAAYLGSVGVSLAYLRGGRVVEQDEQTVEHDPFTITASGPPTRLADLG